MKNYQNNLQLLGETVKDTQATERKEYSPFWGKVEDAMTSRVALALYFGFLFGNPIVEFFTPNLAVWAYYTASVLMGAGLLLIADAIFWPFLWVLSMRWKRMLDLVSHRP
jgi:hypothetical protein